MLASTRKVHGAARLTGEQCSPLQKQPRKAVAFRGCCTCDGKSGLRVRADDVTDDVDDVVSGQAVVTQDLIGGAGVTELILDAGADMITLGNHALRRREIYPMLEESDRIIRPANFHASAPGRGWCLYDCPGKPRVAVINLQGNYLLESHENAFDCMDRLLEEIDAPVKILDFHAEATSEKICMGLYLDGRVSAVIGTHTHIQTADERLLPGGTAYITDAGMCGVFDSALGLAPEPAIRRFRTGLPTRFESVKGPVRLSGVLLEVDGKTGKAVSIKRVNVDG